MTAETLKKIPATAELEAVINTLWDDRDKTPADESARGIGRAAVSETLRLMGAGTLRIAEKTAGGWHVHQWLKKAVLLSFRFNDNRLIGGGPDQAPWFDKVRSRFDGMNEEDFRTAGFRAVPGCFVRESAYLAPRTVIMPSFVNVGAYVGEGTMIDSLVTVGSCAQIGRNCHISGNVLIGGVLEPLQANPVIIEDNCFIGGCSEIAEGVIVEEGAVISMGVHIGASTKIVDRATGEIIYGRVPAYSVVVPGALPGKPFPDGSPGPALACAVIVKRVDEKTRAKTSVNELLRD